MESDLDTAARAALVNDKINRMISIVEDAKVIRKAFNEVHRQSLSKAHSVPGMDEISVASGLAKVSDEFFDSFESALYEIAELARQQIIDGFGVKNLAIIQSFIFSMGELKPRSMRHLENFLSAATDGEWVDGLFLARGKDSEFRCIDQCSDEARKEFGLGPKQK